MKHAKFKKEYSAEAIEKTISFFRKRLDKDSRICNSVENIIKEADGKVKDSIIIHLNKFIKWYSNFYEMLPSDTFKKVYFKLICKLWKEKNNSKWEVLGLFGTENGKLIATHVSNLFAALFKKEKKRLYEAKA